MALVTKNFSDIITFTRASTGTYFNSSGVLTSAAVDQPRFDYNPSTLAAQGLLIEEARTNSIRNNTMQGAVAGSPGTLPTNWSVFTTLTGLTQTIVGTGVENGVTYIEIRLNGTPSAAGTYQWYTEAANGVPATVGQTWTLSQFFKLQAGTLSGVSLVRHFFEERSSGGSYLTEQSITAPNPTAAALSTQRSSATRTLTDPACAFLRSGFNLSLSGVAIDITLRIGLPQLELGAFATSVIPTTTTALTRSADVASVNTLAPWYNQTEGTVYAELQSLSPLTAAQSAALGKFPHVWSIESGANDSNPFWYGVGVELYISGTYNNVGVVPSGINKFAVSLAPTAGQSRSSLNGAAAVNRNGTLTGTATGFFLGRDSTAGLNNFLNGHLRRLTYYPRALSAAELQTITA